MNISSLSLVSTLSLPARLSETSATANWMINRWWTFRHQAHGAAHVQWLKFLAANFIGFIFNRGTFFTLVAISPLCRAQPVLAIIAGTAVGLVFNYFLSKRLVFR